MIAEIDDTQSRRGGAGDSDRTALEAIFQTWTTKLATEFPGESKDVRQGILQWLMGPNPERFEQVSLDSPGVLTQALDYRYRILRQRYGDASPAKAYARLIKRLSSLFLIHGKVRAWIASSRDRQRLLTDVLQKVIQEMIRRDSYLRQQVIWLGKCTREPEIRNLLMLASIEEYCLRPIHNQPLLVYRLVEYLNRLPPEGTTNLLTEELTRLVSEEIAADDSKVLMDLQDVEDLVASMEKAEEEQLLRQQLKQRFSQYLTDVLDPTAAQWLELHLQGLTQVMIAQQLNLSTSEAHDLREKVRYEAIRIFTLREQPNVVFDWLKTSLEEHNLGLQADQWQAFYSSCSPWQKNIIEQLKSGHTFEEIAQDNQLELRQVTGEWAQIYLNAQSLREQG